jgi:hypothetical protein
VKHDFKVGDIVTVSNILGEYDMRVVDVWCDDEPFYLLLTDVEGLSAKANPVSVYDCKLKHRPESVPVKDYRKQNHSYTGSLIKTDLYK